MSNPKEQPTEGVEEPQVESATANREPETDESTADVATSTAETAPEESPEYLALKDKYIRLLADFDNARKRQLRDREEWIKCANERLIGLLLPVLDNLTLARSQAKENDPFVEGVALVEKQFVDVLQKEGLAPIEAEGKPFDPNLHEALSMLPSTEHPANTVLQVYRKGWMLNGKLLRAAQVIVSNDESEPSV